MNRFLTLIFLAGALYSYPQTVTQFSSLPSPDNLEVDRHNNVWVNYTEIGNVNNLYRLVRISPEGFATTVIETMDELGPFGVNDSIIWITSPSAEKVYKYNHSGVRLDSVNVSSPGEILLESDGTWFLAQDGADRILKYTPDNMQHILATGTPLDHNRSLAHDENGILYTCNLFNADVIRVDPETGSKTVIATLPNTTPYSVGYITYNSGKLYFASGLNCIYQLDTAAMDYTLVAGVEGIAGNYGGYAGTALFDSPKGLGFSVTGDTLFVTDANNNAIRRIAGLNSLGIAKNDPADLEVSPNPASAIVRLTAKDDVVLSAIVTDQNGRPVTVACSASGNQLELAVSGLPEGIYFIRVSTEKGRIGHSRFVKTT